jgi:hypothetical protein
VATVTLDTNVLPGDDVLAVGRERGDQFAIASVTERELAGHPLRASLRFVDGPLPELGVWGEGEWGKSIWVGEHDAKRLDKIRSIISNGSFPSDWSSLSPSQLRQLRDALILEAHARACRDVFVTNDQRGFILHGRRAALQAECSTSILTATEYMQSRERAA